MSSFTSVDRDLEFYGTCNMQEPDLEFYGFVETSVDYGSGKEQQRLRGHTPFMAIDPDLKPYGTMLTNDPELEYYGTAEVGQHHDTDANPQVGSSSSSPRRDETVRYRGGTAPDAGAAPAAPQEKAVIVTYNVDGRMRLKGKADATDTEDWGNGKDLKAEATAEWNKILGYMENCAIVVLTELQVSGKQLQAIRARLEGSGPWRTFGTPGGWNPTTGRLSGGVLVAWDERCYVMEHQRVVIAKHVVEVRLQDCRAGMVFTVFGAYMPGRGLKEATVRGAWEKLTTAVEDAAIGKMLIGDLNAELTSALLREQRKPTVADDMLQQLVGAEMMVEAGPEQATYECAGSRSQIDHILCDGPVAAALGATRVIAGLSQHDHRQLEAVLLRDSGTYAETARHVKPQLWKLGNGKSGWSLRRSRRRSHEKR